MEEKYQIFSRKYRPQTFKDIVCQKHVVATIKNSILMKRSPQAYIFSGPKGVGKTTIMRILAKRLNCEKNLEEPCNICSSCREITASSSLDVIEIDGASNRGIDDIREINDTVLYAPSNGNYRIYIIDEVHMLTKEAFNALLKTLEEPPKTVKFFFATTEPQKIPPTIMSRCQRFELTRIPDRFIEKKLEDIATKEKHEISKDAIYRLVKFSDGSLRDAESMLDQLLSYKKNPSKEDVDDLLGLIPDELLFKLDETFKSEDREGIFEIVDELYKKGKDLIYFLEEVMQHFRNILQIKIKPTSPLFEKYKSSKDIYSTDQLTYILEMLTESIQKLKNTPSKKIMLELVLLKVIKSKKRISLSSLTERLLDLEKNISTSPPPQIEKDPLPDNKHSLQNPPPSKELERKTRQDTLINFAAVEFQGTIRKN